MCCAQVRDPDAGNPSDSFCSASKHRAALAVGCSGKKTASHKEASDYSYLPPVGSDPAFSHMSPLYASDVAACPSDWYNTSAVAGEVNQNGVPYGFEHAAVQGKFTEYRI